jgi:hypothetical protein
MKKLWNGIKAFFAKLRTLIEGPPDGIDQHPLSSKRVYALCALGYAGYLSFPAVHGDPQIIAIWLGSATAVLFGQALSRT